MKIGDKVLCKRNYWRKKKLVLEKGKYYTISKIIFNGKGITIKTNKEWVEYNSRGKPTIETDIILYKFNEDFESTLKYNFFDEFVELKN